MSRASVLAAGQRFAQAGMTDVCTIGKVSYSTDPETLAVVATVTEQHYPDPDDPKAIGVCKVVFGTLRVTDVVVGGQPVALQAGQIDLPVGTSGAVQSDDVVVMVSSVNNPSLPGRSFNIKGRNDQSYATAHRFPIEEAS